MDYSARSSRSCSTLFGALLISVAVWGQHPAPAGPDHPTNQAAAKTAGQETASPAAHADLEARTQAIQQLIDAGHYAEAEAAARTLLAAVEVGSGPESLEAAGVLDVLTDALSKGGKASTPEALKLAERAVGIREKLLGPDSVGVADSLRSLGNLYQRRGDYKGAKPIVERALAIMEKALSPDDAKLAPFLSNLGNVYTNTHDYPAARPLYERALALEEKRSGPDSPSVALLLNNLASLLRQTGEYAGAIPLQERAVSIYEKALGPQHPTLAFALTNLGILHGLRGDYAGARGLYERALAIQEKSVGPRHPDVALTCNALGGLLWATGDLPAAKKYFERSLSIREDPGVMNNLAGVLQEGRDYAGARKVLERALAIREKQAGTNDPVYAAMLGTLGEVLFHLGDLAQDKVLQERSLAIAEKRLGPNHPDVASALDRLSSAYLFLGENVKAVELAERAAGIYEKTLGPNHPRLAIALSTLGSAYGEADKLSEAKQAFERALAIQEKSLGPDHPAVAGSLARLGDVLSDLGHSAEAMPLYERALAIEEKALGSGHPLSISPLRGLALAKSRSGKTSESMEEALRWAAIDRDRFRLTARFLSEREALTYSAEKPRALDFVLSLVLQAPDAPLGSRSAAWDVVAGVRGRVLDEMASRHRSLAGGGNPEISQLAEQLSMVQGRLTTLVLRGLGRTPVGTYRSLLEDARREEEAAERALAEKSVAFRQQQAQSRLGIKDVAEALPSGSSLVAFVQYADVRDYLRPESPGKTYSYKPEPAYAAFVLRAGEKEPALIPLGKAQRVDGLVAEWRHELAEAAAAGSYSPKLSEISYRRKGADLRRQVWDPIAPYLAGAKRVFVVPDGTLSLVSFSALPVGRSRYLVESAPLIHYLSTERDLIPAAGQIRGEGLLAVGGPAFDDTRQFAALAPKETMPAQVASGVTTAATAFRGSHSSCADFHALRFDPLPGSVQELKEVVRLWKAPANEQGGRAQALELSGAAASESEFKQLAGGKRVLHLATHGFFLGDRCSAPFDPTVKAFGQAEAASVRAGENPLLLSGLALAGANHRDAAGPEEDDGILTAEEIGALDLAGVDWAVLSACDTGLGEVQTGEGVLGLRRAFQVAGARTVIMSLWPVEDEATRHWMATLYKLRFVRHLDTAESVQAASLELLRNRRAKGLSTHPVHWAAFVAAGDWH